MEFLCAGKVLRMFLVAFREVFCCIPYFIGFTFNGKIRELFFGNGSKRLKISNNSFILQNLSPNSIFDISTCTIILFSHVKLWRNFIHLTCHDPFGAVINWWSYSGSWIDWRYHQINNGPCQRSVPWILNHLLCRNYKRRWYFYHESNHQSTKHNGWT